MSALSEIKHGNEFPYDASDDWWRQGSEDYPKRVSTPPPRDWAHRAARGIVSNLQDRHTIKHGFDDVDEETRQELVETLSEIIRVAYKKYGV